MLLPPVLLPPAGAAGGGERLPRRCDAVVFWCDTACANLFVTALVTALPHEGHRFHPTPSRCISLIIHWVLSCVCALSVRLSL